METVLAQPFDSFGPQFPNLSTEGNDNLLGYHLCLVGKESKLSGLTWSYLTIGG